MVNLQILRNLTNQTFNFTLPIILTVIVILFYIPDLYKRWKSKQLQELKSAPPEKSHGVIFGKKHSKLIYSPENAEGHIGVFSASGTGKTSAIGIPTLRSWKGTSYTIDISGDICKNCPDIPNKLIYNPEKSDTAPYNIFGPIDDLNSPSEKHEALEKLAYLLMPEPPSINDNAKFFLENGRVILTASLIAFYDMGMDFIAIVEKIVGSSWQELFQKIDQSNNSEAVVYINRFEGANEQNTSGCKQTCDSALKLFATNMKIKQSIRRPKKNETAVEPKKIEDSSIFIVIGEDKLALYSPLMNIFTSQIMQYIGTREVVQDSPTILLFLDEYGSLRLEADLVLDAVRRFRKRKCRIMMLMQNTADMTILYGREVTQAILSNLRFKILLGGLGETESQKYFAELIGYKKIKKHSKSQNARELTRTESEEKEYVIEPADLDRQGKHTAILISAYEPNGYIKLKKNYYFNQ